MTKRIVVMISGGGTNLQALIDAIGSGHLPAEIVCVVSNRIAAYGLTRAENAGIDTLYFALKPYRDAGKSREEYDRDLAEKVRDYAPDLIVLAGWMHIFTPAFIDCFKGRIINLHPSLPGVYAGSDAIGWAYEAFQQGEIDRTGVMVHYVIPELDAGPPIARAEVPIRDGDSREDVEARIHEVEHQLIVQATRMALEQL